MALLPRALPLPIHEPTLPDQYLCDPDYGHGIIPIDCQMAVDLNWPSGKVPIHYYTNDPAPSNAIRLPRYDRHGTCTVSIEHAGPDYSTLDYLTFQPDKMRAQAGFVIEKCANQLGGMGGFVTLNFLAAEHYVESLANTIADDLRNETQGKSDDGSFLTITISNVEEGEFQPGNTDPVIATHLSNHAWKYAGSTQFKKKPWHQQFFENKAIELHDTAINMVRCGPENWWDLMFQDNDDYQDGDLDMADTATGPSPSSKPDKDRKNGNYDEGDMTYQCDSGLGAPDAIDCEHLAWSGLKSPDTVETLRPNEPNIYSTGSCALGISSPVATKIKWAHLLTAFQNLNNLCIQNPLKSIKGGRAYHGVQSVSSWINGKTKRDGVGGVGGLEALPKGINTTLWRHDPVSDKKCEWQLAMEGKAVSMCGSR